MSYCIVLAGCGSTTGYRITGMIPGMQDGVKVYLEMIDEDSAILSIYYGEEMNEDSANEIAEKVEEEYPDVEVEVHYGGQPIYYYVISVE